MNILSTKNTPTFTTKKLSLFPLEHWENKIIFLLFFFSLFSHQNTLCEKNSPSNCVFGYICVRFLDLFFRTRSEHKMSILVHYKKSPFSFLLFLTYILINFFSLSVILQANCRWFRMNDMMNVKSWCELHIKEEKTNYNQMKCRALRWILNHYLEFIIFNLTFYSSIWIICGWIIYSNS